MASDSHEEAPWREGQDPSARALREAEERWRLILYTAHDAFVSMDEHGAIIEWNRRAEELFGWDRAEAIGRPLAETIIPPDMRAAHHAGLQRFLATGDGPVLFETLDLPALHRTRGRFDAEVTIWPSRSQGRWSFHAFLRDITQRKRDRTHVALLHRVTAVANESSDVEETTRTALAEVCELTGWPLGHVYLAIEDDRDVLEPSGWWHGRVSGRFIEATAHTTFPIGEGLPGRVAEAGEPMWISDLSEDDNFPRFRSALDDGIRSAFGFPVRSGDRVVAVLEFYAWEVTEPDESLLALMRGIGTQLGRVFERAQATERLREAERTKSRLIATVSHEIRTPLATVTGLAELLAEDWDDLDEAEKRSYAETISRQSRRLTRLAEGLLATSRIDAGAVQPDTTAVAIADVVADVTDGAGAGRDLRADVGDLRVEADRDHLVQILVNLVANARKYGAPPVELRARGEDGGVLVEVADHGPGVPEDLREELFERFAVGPGGGGGAGLGLSISRDLARLNGGELWYEDGPEGGACFVLRLPAT